MNDAPVNTLLQSFLKGGATLLAAGQGAAAWSAELRSEDHAVIAEDAPGSIDGWCARLGLRHVDWLVLHRNGGALAALESAGEMLRLRRIDFVQFDGTEAGGDLSGLYDLLQGSRYAMFRFDGRTLQHCQQPPADGAACTHLAVAPRHWQRLFTRDRSMFHYSELFPRYGIVPRGIVHIGAHEGEEYPQYVEAGCRRVLFVEADPDTYARLAPRFASNPDVTCINRAVSDRAGRLPFSRMSGSQSSSLLPPKEHLDVYPGITLTGTIEVDAAPLPDLLAEFGIDAGAYNVLAIDTQGAERMILAGCGPLLGRFDAVSVEVNYAELYEGCGRIADIDDLLFPHGYQRVEEVSPFHHSWGDAFYVRRG
ncbi:FkbM family methyltransferase [Azospirillum sp.]|uniref:FkbM family methyltransferase n=1 Tax=Azospirillum sp. TaxID=34012 RepID=UPI002D5BECF4|nr:FkbM family methyltransferase [Azospirillum sp.]HYF87851.1 FkbM family methyltransferase [Azospirillum sp.]